MAQHLVHSCGATARRGASWLALFGALLGLSATAAAQDPLTDFKQVLATRPTLDPSLPIEKQQQELKKFYDEREQKLAKIIDTRLRSFSDLRQALQLKDWGDVAKLGGREDTEVVASDIRLRARVGQRFRAKVQQIVDHGDNDSKAAVANLLTELGLTVRAVAPEQPAKGEDADAQPQAGFARSMTDAMLKLAKSDSAVVRLYALRALGGINADPRRVAPALAAALKGSDVKSRRVAADGLLRLVRIASYLKDQEGKSNPVSATDLDVLTAAAAVAQQAPPGLDDSDATVRARCAQALRASAQALATQFQRPPTDTKSAPTPGRPRSPQEVSAMKDVLKAFDDAGPRLIAGLQDPDVDVRLGLVEALERLTDARFRLAEEPISVGAFGKAQDRIRLVPPQASDPLSRFAKGEWRAVARLLGDSDARVRRTAVNFLEYFPEARPAVVADLTRALCDSNSFVRWAAARALGTFSKNYQPKDAVPAVPALAKMLFDNDYTDRLAAAATLESLGEYAEAAVPELARAVHYGDVENRVAALYVIQSIGPERSKAVIPSVTDALHQEDPRVRRIAAETLGRFGPLANNPATVAALRHALGDDDQEVRINASEALLQVLGAGN